MARVLSIAIALDKGEPMQEFARAITLGTGTGLSANNDRLEKRVFNDRYGTGKGAWSKNVRVPRDVSFIATEAIDEANRSLSQPFTFLETRRNILTVGVDLNGLLGKEFLVGDIMFVGVELCDPCDRPSKLCGKPGFKQAFANRGGLRAQILSQGCIEIGSKFSTPL